MQTIRLAVVGAGRGRSHIQTAKSLSPLIQVTAICDDNAESLAPWRDEDEVRLFTDYSDVLSDSAIDAVCIATPIQLHAQQSIQALQAGKHVLCEVTATRTLEECRALLEAARRSDRVYMMAENCCFFREVLMVQNMVEGGVFGDLISAEGNYIHDCRTLFFDAEGELTWRGQLQSATCTSWYPTHSLGPICRWMDVNRSDKLISLATWGSSATACAAYAARNFPADHAVQHLEWRTPDTTQTCVRTQRGALIEHRLAVSAPRPHPCNFYELQGTKAAFASPGLLGNFEPQIWICDQSPTIADGTAQSWESLWKYADQWEHPLWREHGEIALQSGHGGSDFFVMREFAGAIQEKRAPLFDVVDAVTWSCLTPLSAQSLAQNGAPVEVPDWNNLD